MNNAQKLAMEAKAWPFKEAQNLVERFKVGTAGETAGFVPDKMNRVTMAADWPEATRPVVKVLKTKGADFNRFLDTQKSKAGNYPDICDIRIPTQIVEK